MQSYPVSCYLIPLRPKYLPRHPVLKIPSSHIHNWFLTNLWPISLPTTVTAVLSAHTLPHISICKYISLQTNMTYPSHYVSADGFMLLNGGIHLSQVVAVTRVRQHLYHLLEVALPQHTLRQKTHFSISGNSLQAQKKTHTHTWQSCLSICL